MKNYEAKDIYNVALIGHTGKGKTTLAEAMLFNANVINRLGKVSDGTAFMDFDEQEIARKTSISLSVASLEYKGKKINLIDVPGYYDFEAEKYEALSVCDSVIVVGSADGEIAVGTELAIKFCVENRIPILIFINQTDKENADYIGTVESIRRRYPRRTAPLQVPIMEKQKMVGYVDIINKEAFMFSKEGPIPCEIPLDLVETVDGLYQNMMEVGAENDEVLLEKFFETGSLTKEEIIEGFKKGIKNVNAIGIFAGSALYNKGVFNLMNAIITELPSANEIKKIKAFDDKGDEVDYSFDQNEKFMAQVFKTVADPFVGKLNLFKVYSGTLKPGMTVLNSNKDKKEKINAVMFPFAKKNENAEKVCAGDIGAVSKLSCTDTGDTLCDENIFVKFEEIKLPKPVLSMGISAKVSEEEEKVFGGLSRLAEEDNSFTITKNSETHQTLINGMGETHLEIICNKLKSKFKVEAVLEEVKIPYRETIKKTVSAEGTHKKQSGGGGQYGKVSIRFEPYADGDFSFESEVVGGVVPKEYIPAVEKGLLECIKKGVLAGFPVVNLKAVIFDGKYHPVDSNEISFKMAAALAYKSGLKDANPVLLEPVYKVEVIVPESYTGDVMGDFNKRRGKILGMENVNSGQQITAEVPLSEIGKYSTDLRSMTQGRGIFSTEFLRYEEVPFALTEKIVKSFEAKN